MLSSIETYSTLKVHGFTSVIDNNPNVLGYALQKTVARSRLTTRLDPANQYLSHSFVESPDMLEYL